MTAPKKALLYGFLLWLIPFVVAVAIFPLREAQRPLFESIMPVVLAAGAVVFAALYFKDVAGSLREGALLGLTWLGISIAIDLLMFMWGPMKMSFANYMMDIGVTYLIYPAVAAGFGYFGEQTATEPA